MLEGLHRLELCETATSMAWCREPCEAEPESVQAIVDDPLMRHSAVLVFANKQDMVRPLPLTRESVFWAWTLLANVTGRRHVRGVASGLKRLYGTSDSDASTAWFGRAKAAGANCNHAGVSVRLHTRGGMLSETRRGARAFLSCQGLGLG